MGFIFCCQRSSNCGVKEYANRSSEFGMWTPGFISFLVADGEFLVFTSFQIGNQVFNLGWYIPHSGTRIRCGFCRLFQTIGKQGFKLLFELVRV